MRKSNRILLLAVTISALTGGCSSQNAPDAKKPTTTHTKTEARSEPYHQLLPQYPSRYWENELSETIAKLAPDERDLLLRFMERHIKTSPTAIQLPIPSGATIGNAIIAQRIIEIVEAQQEEEIASLRQTIEKKEFEINQLREEVRRSNAIASAATRQIQATPDPSSSQQDTHQYAKALEAALVRYNVPELERQLAISMKKDREDPRWQEFQTDSPITAAIRAQLLVARRSAEQAALPQRK
jgi:type IV pilus biogenesis protein CpaD/CtpE